MKYHPSHGDSLGSFRKEEYDLRFARAKKLMAEAGLDALLITMDENLCYFSGLTGYDFNWSRWMHTWPQLLLLPLEGDPEAIVHHIFSPSATFCYPFKNLEVWSEGNEDDEPAYLKILDSRFKALGLSDKKIGCEIGGEFRMDIPINDFNLLTSRNSGATFVDAGPILRELRLIKSDGELAYLRKACQVMDQAIEGMRERLQVGIMGNLAMQILREEVAKAGGRALWELGSHFPDLFREDGGGDKPLNPGEYFTFDFGAQYGSYQGDYGRTWIVGEPSDEQVRDFNIAARVVTAAVEACAPGVRIADVVQASTNEIARAEARFFDTLTQSGAIGHGVGLNMGEAPGISPFSEEILKPGMVIALEPFILSDYGWINLEQMVAITEDGYELLSNSPLELHRIR
jgi:Xaa-Pro aminopeptidase